MLTHFTLRKPRARNLAGLASVIFAAASFLAPTLSRAQSFSVTDPTTSADGSTYYWTPFTVAGGGGTRMSDPTIDQQTGQVQDDLVGSASTPGFFIRYGQIGGVDSVAFRFVENKLYVSGQSPPAFTGQVSVGMDTNNDGAIDIVLTVIGKNSNNGINYQGPGAGTNTSPSTTTLSNPTLISAFSATNFDYEQINSTLYPNWTQIGTDPDAVLTFAVSFASLNSALNALGDASLTTSTLIRFIAFTSTQTNAINQDIYGPNGISAAQTFTTSGAFSELTTITGVPIPEPSSGVSMGGLLGIGMLIGGLRKYRGFLAALFLKARML